MNSLLDTCVISELVKSEPNKNVLNWIKNTPDDRLFLSVITIGEITKGIVKLPNSKKKSLIKNWLNKLLEDYHDRILPIDLAVAEIWGNILGKAENNGRPAASLDSFIAAVAKAHNLLVVTRNENDFAAADITILNPWKIEGSESGQ